MDSKIRYFIMLFGVFLSLNTYAICIKNITHFSLDYEIVNRNTQHPVPKVQFHSGTVNTYEKKCHAHTNQSGDDWKIYRFDLVKIFKIEDNGQKVLACQKLVEGIANRLDVRFHRRDNSWWCLDKDDYDD